MKAILEFYLPEDEDAYKRAVNGIDYYRSICDIQARLRSIIKHSEVEDTSLFEELRDLLPYDME